VAQTRVCRAEARLGAFDGQFSSTQTREFFHPPDTSLYVDSSRRRLPHFYPPGRWLFLTWHLRGSLPHGPLSTA